MSVEEPGDAARRAPVRLLESPDGHLFHLVFDEPDALEAVGSVPVSWYYRDRGTGFRTEVEAVLDYSEADGRLLALELHGGRENVPPATGGLERYVDAHVAEEDGGRGFYIALGPVADAEPTGTVSLHWKHAGTSSPVGVTLEFGTTDGRLTGIAIDGDRENLPRPMR